MLPKRLNREIIYESQWINLYGDKVLMPSGKTIEKFHLLDYPKESVIVLLTNTNEEICFIKSPRYTTQKVEWELPAGAIDHDEDILKAAKREVIEETGFKAKNCKVIYTFNPDNGLSNQIVHVVVGTVDKNKQIEFDNHEVQSVHWLSFKKTKDLIVRHEINDGCTLISLLLFQNILV